MTATKSPKYKVPRQDIQEKTTLNLGQIVSSKLFIFLAVNLSILLSAISIIIFYQHISAVEESRALVLSNLAVAIEPIVQRFDLTDITNILASISSSNQIQALELIDYYGVRYPSTPDTISLGSADARVPIKSEFNEIGYILVWWDTPRSNELFLYSLFLSMGVQFLASCIIGWYGLKRYINKLIARPLADLQSHMHGYKHSENTLTTKDLGASELNDVYDTFNNVQHKLFIESQEKENALYTLKLEELSRRTLINDISDVMSIANRSIKYFPTSQRKNIVLIGHKIPEDLNRLLSTPDITPQQFIDFGNTLGWGIKSVDSKKALSNSTVTFHLEVQLDDDHFWSIVAVPTSNGGTAYLCMDLSVQKLIETQERNTQHLQALGVLTSGVAHDFNNILAIILASIESNMHNCNENSNAKLAMNAVTRGKTLVAQLLDSSRGKERQVVEVNLKEVFTYLESTFNKSNHPEIRFCFKKHDIQTILAEDGLLESTISNLIINSCQAMNMNGCVIVQASQSSPSTLDTLGLDKTKAYCTVEVIDEGPGVTGPILDKIFDPFFTTKKQNQGTGLGLSMARGFAQRSGGEIFYLKRPEGGAVFGIVLPLLSKLKSTYTINSTSSIQKKDSEKISLNKEKILLVDDEPILLTLLAELLAHLGLEVMTANDYHSACQQLQTTQFKWIISDMYMPEHNGIEVLQQAHDTQPNTKRILMSGNLLYTDLDQDQQHLVEAVLQKPYTLDSLKSLLHSFSD